MKPIISSFLDYKDASLETQIDLFKSLKLTEMFLRKIDGKPIYTFTNEAINDYKQLLGKIKIAAVDPLLPAFNMTDLDTLVDYNKVLEQVTSNVKKLGAAYYIYVIPKFDESVKKYDEVLKVIKEQISIIKQQKLKVFVKFYDDHTAKMYRYILEKLNDKKVSIMFDYVYLYKLGEAEVAAYRILRPYIGLLIMDDVDQLYLGRVLGSGEAIDVKGIAKRFAKRAFDGYVVLDSSLVELLERSKDQKWYKKIVGKTTKLEYKIYNDFVERYQNTDSYHVIILQLAVLSIIFLNKRIQIK